MAHGGTRSLVALLPEALLEVRVKIVRFDDKLSPEVIEQRARDLLSDLRGGATERRMNGARPLIQLSDLPLFLRSAQIRERFIADDEQTAFLEVRGNDAPAAAQVPIEKVAEKVLQGANGIRAVREFGFRLLGEGAEVKVESLVHFSA